VEEGIAVSYGMKQYPFERIGIGDGYWFINSEREAITARTFDDLGMGTVKEIAKCLECVVDIVTVELHKIIPYGVKKEQTITEV